MKKNGWTTTETMVAICITAILIGIAAQVFVEIRQRALKEGVVVSKQYHPAYTTTTYSQVGEIQVPITATHPERYTVTIRGETPEGKLMTRTINVDSITYHNTTNGQWITAP